MRRPHSTARHEHPALTHLDRTLLLVRSGRQPARYYARPFARGNEVRHSMNRTIRLRHLLFCEQRCTSCRATPAGLRADPAVFHSLAMFFAHGGAAFAGLDTRAKLRAREFEISAGKAGHDPGRRQGDVRAVIAIPYARDHLRDVFFAQAGVSAGIAGLSAGVACSDALNDGGVIRRWIHGVGFEHLFDVAHKAG